MSAGASKVYQPRAVTRLGLWTIDGLEWKIYGLTAAGRTIDDRLTALAKSFVQDEVIARVRAEGDDNGAGFLIIHPGSTGATVAAHWWTQGSVLCHHVYRKLYAASEALATIRSPVIGCVWELAIINAEQEIWRRTMMVNEPSMSDYLGTPAGLEAA